MNAEIDAGEALFDNILANDPLTDLESLLIRGITRRPAVREDILQAKRRPLLDFLSCEMIQPRDCQRWNGKTALEKTTLRKCQHAFEILAIEPAAAVQSGRRVGLPGHRAL